ncbi:MAG: hypothetical protein VX871_13320 [Pseudomonadota bacterium]|nr:hypothetical protein [Pseudomonadota bacterium]
MGGIFRSARKPASARFAISDSERFFSLGALAMPRKTYEHITSKGTPKIPALYAREIGRIVVSWSHFELHIQQMIWAIAFNSDPLGDRLGRLAIIEPNMKNRLALLEKAAKLRKVRYDETVFDRISENCKAVVDERNLIAHGAWTHKEPYGWMVQQTRGAWAGNGGPQGTKKIQPEAAPRSLAHLQKTVSAIDNLVADASRLRLSLEYEREPSRGKHQ